MAPESSTRILLQPQTEEAQFTVYIERNLLLPITEVDDVNMNGTFSTVPTIFAQLSKTHIVKLNRVIFIIE